MLKQFLSFILLLLFLQGCSLFKPFPPTQTLEERLQNFPKSSRQLAHPVQIYWHPRGIPFIDAKSDRDLAFTLGMVHAHLRLSQIEMLRRISQGRISEIIGPFARKTDQALRTINFGKIAQELEQNLPDATHDWLTSFADGINHYTSQLDALPHMMQVMGMKQEPWSVKDLLTIGRLAGADVNWLKWTFYLGIEDHEKRQRFIKEFGQIGRDSLPSFEPDTLAWYLASFNRSGSNSIAISPHLSESGSALLANDPHVGISLPNFWMLAGYRSPSFHTVGFSIPGLPFIGVGRNPSIAWGGTNMRSRSSAIYSVEDNSIFSSRDETISARWWWDKPVTIREYHHDPILSDIELFGFEKTTAIKWLGHEISDEFTAFLQANRARNFSEFRKAFKTYAISGQNMLYADNEGHIGQVLATRIPVAGIADFVESGEPSWEHYLDATTLPAAYDPVQGFLISSNNKPTITEAPISRFFSPNDRFKRLNELVKASTPITMNKLKTIQHDTYSPSSGRINQHLVAILQKHTPEFQPYAESFLQTLQAWDGRYDADSKGALAFQSLLHHFILHYFTKKYDEDLAQSILSSGYAHDFVLQILERTDEKQTADILHTVLPESYYRYLENSSWGDVHRLQLAHLLGRLPLIGERYRFADLPYFGSNETVRKSAHTITPELHSSRYGANAAHISDMSDINENYFLLMGGNDGTMGSENFLDMLEGWMNQEYVRLPLEMEQVKEAFPYRITIRPTIPRP